MIEYVPFIIFGGSVFENGILKNKNADLSLGGLNIIIKKDTNCNNITFSGLPEFCNIVFIMYIKNVNNFLIQIQEN